MSAVVKIASALFRLIGVYCCSLGARQDDDTRGGFVHGGVNSCIGEYDKTVGKGACKRIVIPPPVAVSTLSTASTSSSSSN